MNAESSSILVVNITLCGKRFKQHSLRQQQLHNLDRGIALNIIDKILSLSIELFRKVIWVPNVSEVAKDFERNNR